MVCRRTRRQSAALELITLALGGAAGSRLAVQLGILASDSTLLRQLRRRAASNSAATPRVLGIDDWAWRKGHRYGTILCDLERGKVIDLLPERTAESAEQWLRATLVRRSSVATAPVCMPKQLPGPRPRLCRLPIVGICCTT